MVIGFSSFSEFENTIETGQLTENDVQFLKENYNWNSEDFLIVNFKQPRSSCQYDNYKNLKKSVKWGSTFYAELKLEHVRTIFIYADHKKAKKVIDSKSHFEDINSFIYTTFFSKDQTCVGIVVVNKKGVFQKHAGEYTQENVAELVKNLK